MPLASWQKQRNALRPERRKYPPVPAGTPCALCDHVRSSHSMVIMSGRCHVDGCSCPFFEPTCGCGHVLSAHSWASPPDHWGCAQCVCRGFGADLGATLPTLF
jgi:hypothetical protein